MPKINRSPISIPESLSPNRDLTSALDGILSPYPRGASSPLKSATPGETASTPRTKISMSGLRGEEDLGKTSLSEWDRLEG